MPVYTAQFVGPIVRFVAWFLALLKLRGWKWARLLKSVAFGRPNRAPGLQALYTGFKPHFWKLPWTVYWNSWVQMYASFPQCLRAILMYFFWCFWQNKVFSSRMLIDGVTYMVSESIGQVNDVTSNVTPGVRQYRKTLKNCRLFFKKQYPASCEMQYFWLLLLAINIQTWKIEFALTRPTGSCVIAWIARVEYLARTRSICD